MWTDWLIQCDWEQDQGGPPAAVIATGEEVPSHFPSSPLSRCRTRRRRYTMSITHSRSRFESFARSRFMQSAVSVVRSGDDLRTHSRLQSRRVRL